MERILGALQATYPGLYFIPAGSTIIRTDHIEELIDSERAHVNLLGTMAVKYISLSFAHCISIRVSHHRLSQESAEVLHQAYKSEGMIMDCLAVYLERLHQYHDHILWNLEKTLSSFREREDWSNIFALDVGLFHRIFSLNGYLTKLSF